mmetsp:Transcript_19064/g.72082  ORF Transcript_19064/g.72082 Transcript_19064/m.72082 type:complete len:257 (-) Transcript_19064:2642-3412(-)
MASVQALPGDVRGAGQANGERLLPDLRPSGVCQQLVAGLQALLEAICYAPVGRFHHAPHEARPAGHRGCSRGRAVRQPRPGCIHEQVRRHVRRHHELLAGLHAGLAEHVRAARCLLQAARCLLLPDFGVCRGDHDYSAAAAGHGDSDLGGDRLLQRRTLGRGRWSALLHLPGRELPHVGDHVAVLPDPRRLPSLGASGAAGQRGMHRRLRSVQRLRHCGGRHRPLVHLDLLPEPVGARVPLLCSERVPVQRVRRRV